MLEGFSGYPNPGPPLCSGFAARMLPGHHCSLPSCSQEEGGGFLLFLMCAWCVPGVCAVPQGLAGTDTKSMSPKTASSSTFGSSNTVLSR